jgi:hypothetical protein
MERGDPPSDDVIDAGFGNDTDAEPISRRVVRAVAVATDTAPEELPPLYYAIDPEALDALFDAEIQGSGNCSLSFSYADTDVFLAETGEVHVHPAAD